MKIALCLILIFASAALFGHGPSSIEVTFNDSLDLLYVKASHSVPSVTAHHIKSIKLIINGKDFVEQKFSRQSNKDFEEAYFLYRKSEADTLIEISASCNIFGSKKVIFSNKGGGE